MIKLFKKIWQYKTCKFDMIMSIIFSVLNTILNGTITAFLPIILNAVYNGERYINYLNIFLIINGTQLVASYLRNRYGDKIKTDAIVPMYNELVHALVNHDYDIFTKYESSYIQSAFEYVFNIADGGKFIMQLLTAIMDFVVIIYFLFKIDHKLMIISVPIYIVGAFLINKIWKILIKKDESIHIYKVRLRKEVERLVYGFSQVRMLCMQQYHCNETDRLNAEFSKNREEKSKIVSLNNFVIDSVDCIGTIVVLLYCISTIPYGLSTSVAMTAILYTWRLINPILNILAFSSELSETIVQFDKFEQFINIEKKITDGPLEKLNFRYTLKLQGVWFKYYSSDQVLQCIDMDINKGEKIGICGPSGGGKTTILKLLCRFYDPDDGKIMIDNVDIKDYTLNTYRSLFGVVDQNSYIFNGTIYENITYGCKDISITEVIDACKKASIYDFINGLKDGFETNVGPSGLKLSGGQQQRLMLARIFLLDPEIILLDEATSALDYESESIIQDSLSMFKDKTIITIAHRLSTIKNSDKIYVIDDHRVKESGNHDELMKKHGIYASMIELSKRGREV